MFRFRHRMRPRKMAIYPAAGQDGRLKRLRQIVSGLVRYERLEPRWTQADEARQYAERLIYLAVKNGDKHGPTMELADFWLLEKDLIHKLFKVLVPRYQNFTTCYTDLHKKAGTYPGSGNTRGVLELRGNPWPPVVPHQRDTKLILSNILVAAARHDYYAEKKQKQHQQEEVMTSSLASEQLSSNESVPDSLESPTSLSNAQDFSSSVDPTPLEPPELEGPPHKV